MEEQRHHCYVIVHSVAKRHNVGMLMRSCSAFAVKQMLVVGKRELNTFGSRGTNAFVDLKHFYKLKEAREYLKGLGCSICGVEIMDAAEPIQAQPFRGSTAFLLGNEGSGLSEQEKQVCDHFVYIPQHGAGTASLNVVVAASIVLHHFTVWASYPEQPHENGKFHVGERPARRVQRGLCPEEDPEVVAQRRRESREEGKAGQWEDVLEGSSWSLECQEPSCVNDSIGGSCP